MTRASALLSILALAFLFEAGFTKSYATAYYVDAAAGNDTNSGSSTAPWKSLTKVSSITFQPGDSISFKAGETWTGLLSLHGLGTSTNWITVGSYGTGSAPMIKGSSSTAIAVKLGTDSGSVAGYWVIQNLAISAAGVAVQVGTQTSATTHGVHLLNLQISSINGSGVDDAAIWFVPSMGSMDDVLISGNSLQNVAQDGIWFENINSTLATNVVISGNTINSTGANGIVVGAAENPMIENNTVYYVGATNTDGTTFAGIFPIGCDNGTIQHNEVGFTAVGMPGATMDSQAFDLDEKNSGTFYYQYNYTHDNAGGFYENTKNSLNGATDQCILRYNVSQNDGNGVAAANAGGLFRITGQHLTVYNNTFYNANGIVYIQQWYSSLGAASFVNNIFVAPKGFYSDANDNLTGGNPANFTWDHNLFSAVMDTTIPDSHALYTNPLLTNPGKGGNGFSTATGYQLQATSPAINAGAVISSNGGLDFYGNPLPTTAPDMGADQQSTVFQAESLTVPNYLGPDYRTISESGASGGEAVILDSNAVGDYLTFLVPGIQAGNYDVKVGVKNLGSRGIWQLAMGRADNYAGTANNFGAPYDEYSSNPSGVYTVVDLGVWSPSTSSDKWFRFTITGKNASSTGYTECIDYITLTGVH